MLINPIQYTKEVIPICECIPGFQEAWQYFNKLYYINVLPSICYFINYVHVINAAHNLHSSCNHKTLQYLQYAPRAFSMKGTFFLQNFLVAQLNSLCNLYHHCSCTYLVIMLESLGFFCMYTTCVAAQLLLVILIQPPVTITL